MVSIKKEFEKNLFSPVDHLSIFSAEEVSAKTRVFTIPGLCRNRFFINKDLPDSCSVRKVDVTQEFWNFYFLTVSSPTNFFFADPELKVPLVFLIAWSAFGLLSSSRYKY